MKKLAQTANTIQSITEAKAILIQPSCSLQHCPVNKETEDELDGVLLDALAFSDEKIKELVNVKEYVASGEWPNPSDVSNSMEAIETLQKHICRNNEAVANELAHLSDDVYTRSVDFEKRLLLQQEVLQLPLFPTTTPEASRNQTM